MLTFSLFQPYAHKLIHGVTLAKEGNFNDESPDFEKSVQWLKKEYGIKAPAYAKQIHSDIILEIGDLPAVPPIGDAFITWKKNIPLMIKTADCQGILIYDKARDAIAAVHSGWRGSLQNILGKTIQAMREAFNSHPSNLLIGIGPSLGPCCSQFTDPQKELPSFCEPYFLPDRHVDFWQMSLDQCADMKVPAKNIQLMRQCAKCDPAFFSHRRGDKGRMANFIGLR